MEVDRRTLLATGSASLALAAIPVRAQTPARATWVPDGERLEQLERLATERGVPGASAAVFEDGEVAWTWTYGVQNVETAVPVNPFTLFQAASLSKPVTAYTAMQMVEHGLLDLDNRLVDYHRPEGLSDHPWSSEVTVRHALSHSSGLPNWPDRVEDVVIQPAFQPGTRYEYSGQAFQWVQGAMERISGKSLHQLVSHYLFQPAGLGDMAMLWLPGRAAREALGHVRTDEGVDALESVLFDQVVGARLHEVAGRWGRELTSFTLDDYRAAYDVIDDFGSEVLNGVDAYRWRRPEMALANAASSLRTTPADYARFMALMLPGPSPKPGLLSDAGRRMMLSVQTEREPDKATMPAGIGWGLEHFGGRTVYHHWGQNGRSYVSNALGDPASGRTIVVMANGDTGGPFIDAAAMLLTGENFLAYA